MKKKEDNNSRFWNYILIGLVVILFITIILNSNKFTGNYYSDDIYSEEINDFEETDEPQLYDDIESGWYDSRFPGLYDYKVTMYSSELNQCYETCSDESMWKCFTIVVNGKYPNDYLVYSNCPKYESIPIGDSYYTPHYTSTTVGGFGYKKIKNNNIYEFSCSCEGYEEAPLPKVSYYKDSKFYKIKSLINKIFN